MKRATVAEFHKEANGRFTLFSLTVVKEGDDRGRQYLVRETYDVDHSRRYGYLFEMSGCGGSHAVPVSGPYFATREIEVEEKPSTLVNRKARKRNRTRRLRAVPKAFDVAPGQDLLGWLECHGIQQKGIWCSECRDWVPSDELCEHCWWCDASAWYSTPSERCECKSREECNA